MRQTSTYSPNIYGETSISVSFRSATASTLGTYVVGTSTPRKHPFSILSIILVVPNTHLWELTVSATFFICLKMAFTTADIQY